MGVIQCCIFCAQSELFMPTPLIRSLAYRAKKTVEHVEELWHEAKEQAKAERPNLHDGDYYAFVVGIVKNRLGLDEAFVNVMARLAQAAISYRGKKYKSIYEIPNLWVMNIISSSIDEAAYDIETETMYIQFSSAKSIDEWYAYKPVKLKLWADFTKADSKGQFFLDNIKDDIPYTKSKSK